MEKYSFQLTEEEIREFCFRALREYMRPYYAKILLILVLVGFESLLLPWVGVMLLLFTLLVLGVFVGKNYSMVKKTLYGKKRVMWTEGGRLKLEAEGELYSEIPCGNITVFKVTRRLLMLGWRQGKKKIGWYPMPLRVFGDIRERERFVEAIRNSGEQEGAGAWEAGNQARLSDGEAERPSGAEGQGEYLRLCFPIGEEEWVEMYSGATEIIQAGTLGGKNKSRLVQMAVAALFLIVPCWAIWSFPSAALTTYSALFVGTLCFLAIMQNLKGDPRKKLRMQLRRGMVQGNNYGNWEISVTDMGIRQDIPGNSSTVMPWESLLCLVEAEKGFFLFQKDKRHFTMIPAECMESREQAELLKGLFRERQIAVLVGKKEKYLPGWIFFVGKCATMCVYFAACIWRAVWGSQDHVYPGYVPLDKQAEVLRSLGFQVPQEVVDDLHVFMDEYDMSAYVEEYPYTWLLCNLAVYGEGEEGNGLGGVDMFWFDFEGWDISTDYIMVLEGMKDLASGSILDGIGDIREDMADVDWERGTGKVRVLLEWDGQEYSWRMDMDNDWIDAEVLGIYNGLLRKEDVPERFYVTGDGGQGAIVFFCGQEWAARFEDSTGLELEAYTVKKGW